MTDKLDEMYDVIGQKFMKKPDRKVWEHDMPHELYEAYREWIKDFFGQPANLSKGLTITHDNQQYFEFYYKPKQPIILSTSKSN